MKPNLPFWKKATSPDEATPGDNGNSPGSFGSAGPPIDRNHPFYFGFLAATGAVISITMLKALASASEVFVLIIISLFFAAGLNPAVEFFRRRGLKRSLAVYVVVILVLFFVAIFAAVVIPPAISQVGTLFRNAPALLGDLKSNHFINNLNDHYGIIDSLQSKFKSGIKNGQFVVGAFGGVLGVGKAVVSGAVAFLTITVLTLYFLASLPSITAVGYRFVPATRRERVSKISDAIILRIGGFVGGQIAVAFIASMLALIMALTLGLPYPAAISFLIFVCGSIPLVGHLLGCTTLTLIALSKSPTLALISFVAYVVYVQIENYVITPRIMRRSVSVPGLVTIIAALIGVSLLGIVGALLAVPLAAAVILIVEEVVLPRADVT